MWFHSLFASWKSGQSRSRRPQLRPARQGTRLALEHLEDRMLPSAYTAASVSALIADINAANTAGGANTITLTAPTTSPYALTAVNNGGVFNTPGNGLPVIAANDNLTIVGNGDTIERTAGPTVAFRLLDVAPLAALTLQNLTLQGGLVGGTVAASGGGAGGAIYNQGALTLSGVTVANNQATLIYANGQGGGGIWSNGSLTLENGTLLEGNVAHGAQGVAGGLQGEGPGTAPGPAFGGAVYVAGGTANISNSTFTGNSVVGGGLNAGEPSGAANAFGGALYVAAGQVTLTNATMNNNTAYAYYAPALAYGGGLYVAGGTVTLANNTVESNGATYGAGLYVAGGTVTLTNDTVQSNVASGYGGGICIVSGATV